MLRRARPEDAPRIAQILRAAMRGAMENFPELHTPEEDLEHVRARVLVRNEVWVAEIDGEVAGWAALGHDEESERDFLYHLYVAPEHQRRGVGDALFAMVKERFPDGFRWYVFQENRGARAFYDARGGVAIEFSDAGGEEQLPDALYEWRPNSEIRKARDTGA